MKAVKKGSAFPLGVSQTADGLQFAIHAPEAECICLEVWNREKVICRIDMEPYRIGTIYSICLEKQRRKDWEGYTYHYQVDGKWLVDPYATRITGTEEWGRGEKNSPRFGIIWEDGFAWKEDRDISIPYCDMSLYQLHVRGFTKDASSGVSYPGTFYGIIEKIPYLRELRMNALLLLPCYDFQECMKPREGNMYTPVGQKKKNYWGYTGEAFYFSPKASYASQPQRVQEEMKEMVQALHRNGIEVLMELYFPHTMPLHQVLDVLRYWVIEYRINGFRIHHSGVPLQWVAKDPVVGSVKLLGMNWEEALHAGGSFLAIHKNRTVDTAATDLRLLAEYNDGFRNAARRFLRGEEGQIGWFKEEFCRNPGQVAVVRYMTSVNGFTMMDLVSYDTKHNEENGERNMDGEEVSYSWNCGWEGSTKKKQINALRRQQIKNAWLMLYFSQGIPMLLAGDEFLQTQGGNNNPYCQDNRAAWLNWDLLDQNRDMHEFLKEVIRFRKTYQGVCSPGGKQICGMYREYPKISFHSRRAWYSDTSNYSRFFAILFYGALEEGGKVSPRSVYLAFNMHHTVEEFELPSPMPGQVWSLQWDTSAGMASASRLENQRRYRLMPHSAIVLCGIEEPSVENRLTGSTVGRGESI